jgi:hypothetical protein
LTVSNHNHNHKICAFPKTRTSSTTAVTYIYYIH